LISVAFFISSLGYDILSADDRSFIHLNYYVRGGFTWENITGVFGFRSPGRFWYPVVFLTYMADHSIYGLSPWGYHLTNVLLHGVNVILVFVVLKLLL
jgi:hypothetical protein